MYDQKILKFVVIALILLSQTQLVEECFLLRPRIPAPTQPTINNDLIDEIIKLLTEIRDTLAAALARRPPVQRP